MLKLTQAGFKYYEYDREAPQFKDLKNDWEKGVYYVKNKITGERVAEFKSDLEREEFWQIQKPLKESLLCHLKDYFVIDPGVTMADLITAIDNSHIMAFPSLVRRLYRGCWENCDFTTEISRKVEIANSTMRLIPTGNFNPNDPTPLTVNNNISIFGNNVHCDINFIDVLEIVFGMEKDKITIREEGFFDSLVNKIDPIDCLFDNCYVEDKLTLSELFDIVANNELLKSLVMIYSTVPHINAFHTVARRAAAEETGIFQLDIYDSGEIWHHKTSSWFSWDSNFSGLGKPEKEMYADTPEEKWPESVSYALDLIPINNIAHLPLNIDHNYKVVEFNKTDIFNRVEHFVGLRDFTVLEFLDAIYDEISFHGTPSGQAEFFEDVMDRVKEIQDNPELIQNFTSISKKLEKKDE